MELETREFLVASIAMSLYQYNVAPGERADKLIAHFAGNCAEPEDMHKHVESRHWATSMALPTAHAYLQHALERYRDEARERIASQDRYDREVAP